MNEVAVWTWKLLQIGVYLEDQGDLVSRLIMGIMSITILVIGVINLLTKFP